MTRAIFMALLLGACSPTPDHALAWAPSGQAPLETHAVDLDPADPQPATCDVEVSFGSFAAGPDIELKQRISDLVQSNPDVTDSRESPWGREGETTLCLYTRDGAAADRLYAAIVAMIPTRGPRAPTTVTHRDGRAHSTSGPGRH